MAYCTLHTTSLLRTTAHCEDLLKSILTFGSTEICTIGCVLLTLMKSRPQTATGKTAKSEWQNSLNDFNKDH
ncbi:hypothetical protein KIN20_030552 [Parelaphostrongylus tenuis]|nr:hypothetical protein KIN20_030552 [Parelaphostrongylus tenuis]